MKVINANVYNMSFFTITKCFWNKFIIIYTPPLLSLYFSTNLSFWIPFQNHPLSAHIRTMKNVLFILLIAQGLIKALYILYLCFLYLQIFIAKVSAAANDSSLRQLIIICCQSFCHAFYSARLLWQTTRFKTSQLRQGR